MAPLLPSLFLRVAALGGVEEKHRAHLKDRQPIALVWKDEHSSKIKARSARHTVPFNTPRRSVG